MLKCGLEVHYGEQIEALSKFYNTVTNLRVKGKKSLMPWQHGVRTSTNAILKLYELFKNTYGMKFILTSRFNQVGVFKKYRILIYQ